MVPHELSTHAGRTDAAPRIAWRHAGPVIAVAATAGLLITQFIGRGDVFDVAVASGVRPEMAAGAVAGVADAELRKMAALRHANRSQYDIVRLDGVRYADVGAITGTAFTPDASQADDVTWVVSVKGPLISWISLPGGRDNVADSGFLLINDKLGEVVGIDLD